MNERFTRKESVYYEKAIRRLQELEDKLESGEPQKVINKPLTVGELKALEVGDWVWVVKLDNTNDLTWRGQYFQLCHREQGLVLEGKYYAVVPNFDKYGTDWVAFKNKEQAESHAKKL